ncbi:DUF3397 family protein [Streptococcus catagoni]|uniref:DUF3397 family protein n=1 Tax=Streptococcus catagoni TaxID=2654874 RepID=UPI001408AE63|nr:DUF3397 family protein [Streptococcus catagoni]
MNTYKLIAAAFILLTPIFSHILVSTFKLGRYGIKFPDLAFILFAIEIILVSGKFFTHNLLPYYLIALSILAIIITLMLVIKIQHFNYSRFAKLFWRVGFLLTFLAYLLLVIFIFIKY